MTQKPKPIGRIVLIHGVHFRKSSRHNLRRVAAAFSRAGFCVILPKYGFMPALLIGLFKWTNNRIADSMAAFIEPGDILLGHSNGATLVYLISQKVHIKGAILVNAALDSETIPDAEFVHVYYNRGDWIAALSALIPYHPWGSMGSYGYEGDDPRVTNIDQGNPPKGLPRLNGHSDIFQVRKTRPWTKYMADLAVEALKKVNFKK